MNLKRYLLTRMITLGLICWAVVSGIVVYRTNSEVSEALESDAQQLQEKVEYAFYMRRMAPEAEGSVPMLGNQYGLKLGPYCLRYEGFNGEQLSSQCAETDGKPLPVWLAKATGIPTEPLQETIHLWGQPFGELNIVPDKDLVLHRFWLTLRDLLLLTGATVLSLSILAYVAIGKALGATTELVSRLDRVDDPHAHVDNEEFQQGPIEFKQIAQGIARLGDRLRLADLARQNLTRQLLQVQEAERRDLAHLVHADLGQSLSVISLQLSQLRSAVAKEDADGAALQLDMLSDAMDEAFEKLRGVLVNKCPPVMEGANLGLAIQDMCTDWRIRTGKDWEIDLHLEETALRKLNKDKALCVYRTIEESLVNVNKHGDQNAPVSIHLIEKEGGIEVSVVNKTRAVSATHQAGSGMGLQLLAERVRVYGGVWTVTQSVQQFAVSAFFKQEQFA